MEVLEFLRGGADKHVTHEEGMVGASANDANADAVALIPASVAINNVDAVPGVEVVYSTLTVDTPNLGLSVSIVRLCIVTSHEAPCKAARSRCMWIHQ